jgi:hypothetical protein
MVSISIDFKIKMCGGNKTFSILFVGLIAVVELARVEHDPFSKISTIIVMVKD